MSIPHVGPIDPLRDVKNVEFDLMISDLTQVEKRLERLEKDLKKGRTSELEREQALLLRSKGVAGEGAAAARAGDDGGGEEADQGLYVSVAEADFVCGEHWREHDAGRRIWKRRQGSLNWTEIAARPNAGATAICGKVEAELAEMDDEEATEFLA